MHVGQHSPATSKSCKLVSYVEHKLHSLEASRDLGLLCDSCMGVKRKGGAVHSAFTIRGVFWGAFARAFAHAWLPRWPCCFRCQSLLS